MGKEKQPVAWVVSDMDEGYGKVIFHHHELAARRIGAERLGEEFESVEIRRASEYDQYAEHGRVPVKVLIDNGWWFHCFHCHNQIHQDNEDYDVNDMVIEDDEFDKVYCDVSCKKGHEDEVAEVNAKHAAFKSIVTSMRPDLEFSHFSSGYPVLTPSCNFSFPGCQFGGSAQMDRDSDEIKWYVANADKEAWEAYQKQRSK